MLFVPAEATKISEGRVDSTEEEFVSYYHWLFKEVDLNVLFLIGNGFDLALRLGTSYESFYRYCQRKFTKCKDVPTNICDEFLAKMIDESLGKNNQLWSDLELAMGHFDYQRLNSEKGFSISNKATDIKWILEDELRAFLCPKQVSARTQLNEAPNLVRSFALKKLRQLITSIEDLCKTSISSNLNIRFLSLNYTDSLEFLYGDSFLTHHAHRSLNDGVLIFGVDNHNQFTNDMGPHEQLLTKLGQLQTNGLEWVEDDTRRMILDSDVIVCYGLSFGATDNRIWRMIRGYLEKSRQSKVVLCPYLKNIETASMGDRERCRSSFRQRFLDAITEHCLSHEGLRSRYDAQILVMSFVKENVNDNEMYSNDYLRLDRIADMLGIPNDLEV